MNLSIPRAAAAACLLAVPALALALITGTCRGSWSLPSAAPTGIASGVLTDASGQEAFQMEIGLISMPTPGSFPEFGTFFGSLDDGSGTPYPLYAVSGTYSGSPLTKTGSFRGVISRQASPKGPVAIIGRIGGQYSDPASSPENGQFKGEWKANL